MGRPFSERGKVERRQIFLGPGLRIHPGPAREEAGWGRAGRGRQRHSRTYLQVEAVQRGAELLAAGQTVLLTAAGHAGEQAEQQEVTQQDFHGAGAAGKMLEHKGG